MRGAPRPAPPSCPWLAWCKAHTRSALQSRGGGSEAGGWQCRGQQQAAASRLDNNVHWTVGSLQCQQAGLVLAASREAAWEEGGLGPGPRHGAVKPAGGRAHTLWVGTGGQAGQASGRAGAQQDRQASTHSPCQPHQPLPHQGMVGWSVQKDRLKGWAPQNAHTICPVALLDTGRQPPERRAAAGLSSGSKPYAPMPCAERAE